MIYSSLLFLVLASSSASAYDSRQPLADRRVALRRRIPHLKAMGKTSVDVEESDGVPMVNVRFINTVSGKDVVATAPLGANLLTVGDNAGVKLPRACRTGLCGSCTCEVKDPAAIDGFATVRACSANVFVPAGQSEMVVDVYRMRQGQVGGAGSKGGASAGAAPDAVVQYVSAHRFAY